MRNWRIKEDLMSDCGAEEQAMYHIVRECEHRKFIGTLEDPHTAVQWFDNLDVDIQQRRRKN